MNYNWKGNFQDLINSIGHTLEVESEAVVMTLWTCQAITFMTETERNNVIDRIIAFDKFKFKSADKL